jgi:D-alanyl-D-alanine dipeptidase
MPTPFDDFSERAHRDCTDLSAEVIRNRETLERTMLAEGFEPLATEWWHFDAPGWRSFPVLDFNPYDEPLCPDD